MIISQYLSYKEYEALCVCMCVYVYTCVCVSHSGCEEMT